MVFAVSSNNFCQRQLSVVAPVQLQTPTDFAAAAAGGVFKLMKFKHSSGFRVDH